MRSVLTLLCTLLASGLVTLAAVAPSLERTTDGRRMDGTVLETIDVASYTYVRLGTDEGEVWAAVPRANLKVGVRVVIQEPMAMTNFESKSLGRTFDTIYFGSLGSLGSLGSGGDASDPHGGMLGDVANTRNRAPEAAEPIAVAKAEGPTGKTIAEVHAGRAGLAGRSVTVRGKVVKFTAGIMGRNWIHLQDGTGDAANRTNDVTVTSSDTAEVGQIVTIEGILAVDRDFGAGYRYDAIIEDARVR